MAIRELSSRLSVSQAFTPSRSPIHCTAVALQNKTRRQLSFYLVHSSGCCTSQLLSNSQGTKRTSLARAKTHYPHSSPFWHTQTSWQQLQSFTFFLSNRLTREGSGGSAGGAWGVVAASNKGKDMYSDLARYGIMDEYDMAPLPFLPSVATPTLGAPNQNSQHTLSRTGTGRTRKRVEDNRTGEPEVGGGFGSESGFGSTEFGEHLVPNGSATGVPLKEAKAAGAGAGRRRSSAVESAQGTWCVYLLLASDEKKTYVGVTNDVERRVKQHNGDAVGGAKSTRAGRPWRLLCSISGFQTRSEAFQFEWRWKNPRAIKGDGSFDRDSMAPSAQILRDSEAAARKANPGGTGGAPVPLVVEKRRAALEEALRTFPKWRLLKILWVKESGRQKH